MIKYIGFFVIGLLIPFAWSANLPLAAYHGNYTKVVQLLKSGVNPNSRDSSGGTALHAAMFQSNLKIITVLLKYHAHINVQGLSNGYTPLHDSVWAGNIKAACILLKNGADASIRNNDGQTPEDFAKASHKQKMAKLLFAYTHHQDWQTYC